MTLSPQANAFLESRKLDPELAVRLGLDSYGNGSGGEEIAIPFVVGTETVNHKYRRLADKRFRQDKGGVQCFWNFNALHDPTLASEPVIITEGEFDAIAAIQCGFPRSVSVPGGAPEQSKPEGEDARRYEFLAHAKSVLKDAREIILAVDGDRNGQALMNDLSIRLGKARCKWVKYPKGCKDLNDTLALFGERGVREVMRRAEWCKVDGVYRMSDLPPYPVRERYSTGMPFLDPHYRIRMGDLCVITGVPGHGKSTMVNDIVSRMATEHGWRIAIASFEQHPQADHQRALREWYCRCPVFDERGRQLLSDVEIAAADKWIDEHFVFIVPSDDDLANLAWSLDKCAAAVIRHGVRMIVIDPWNELDHDRPPDMSLTEYTGKAIKQFKAFARSLDVHVIVVAHPTKLTGGERPGLYSISDSAHWANKPDVGIVVWKESPEQDFAEIKVVKSRYHDQIGKPGTAHVVYIPTERRFHLNERHDADRVS